MDNEFIFSVFCNECGERLEIFTSFATNNPKIGSGITVMPCRSCIRKEILAKPPGKKIGPPDPACENCEGTGWCGDNGPGRKGNNEFINTEPPRKGQPCGHPGCFHHVTHPCERCGRIAGHYPGNT